MKWKWDRLKRWRDNERLEAIYYLAFKINFIKQFNEYAENFDIDDHAEMYIPMRGQNGVPDSISDLVEDAKWIKNTLMEVGSKLRDLENELEVEAER